MKIELKGKIGGQQNIKAGSRENFKSEKFWNSSWLILNSRECRRKGYSAPHHSITYVNTVVIIPAPTLPLCGRVRWCSLFLLIILLIALPPSRVCASEVLSPTLIALRVTGCGQTRSQACVSWFSGCHHRFTCVCGSHYPPTFFRLLLPTVSYLLSLFWPPTGS